MSSNQPPPVFRVAPLGELRAYTISEEELHELARGGNVSLDLNFAIALLSIWITIVITFWTVSLSGQVYTSFFCAGLITFIIGVFLLIKGLREYRSTTALVQTIKNRLPPPMGVQETTNVSNL